MIRIYFASKLKHAQKWRQLCAESTGFIAHARWLKHNKIGTADTAENARAFWFEDEQDIATADAVVVYGEEGEHLRGALVEAGIGIGLGKRVLVVGDHPDYGTWQFHHKVTRCATLDGAIQWLLDT